jgi:hypothetical protein
MSDLIDKNLDANGKVQIKFSQEPIRTKPVESATYYSTEKYAHDELLRLKMRVLAHSFDLHNDDPDTWFYLALNLAQLHYPEPKKAGRKLKWNNQHRLLLLNEVDRMVDPSDSTNGVNRVCKKLAKTQPWQLLVEGVGNPSEALRAQYYIAKDKIKK